MFKAGDKVISYTYGAGEVVNETVEYPNGTKGGPAVLFPKIGIREFNKDGRRNDSAINQDLFLADEYPENLPQPRPYLAAYAPVKVWNNSDARSYIRCFSHWRGRKVATFNSHFEEVWDNYEVIEFRP